MLTLAAAICLTAALAIDVSRGGSPTLAAIVLAVAGMAFVLLASAFPRWPRHRPRRLPVSGTPHFGFTRHGHAVHLRTLDHLPVHSAYARLNKRVALAVTGWVGSMSCAWAFCLLALLSLPAVLTQAFHVHWFPGWLVAVGLIALVAWIAQTFLQLVLLSVIMVGQNVQQAASDARAAKTFEDTEVIVDRLDVSTEGGIKAILDALEALAAQVASMKAAPAKRLASPAERSTKRSGT